MTKSRQSRFSAQNNHKVPANPIFESTKYYIVKTYSMQEAHSPSTTNPIPWSTMTSEKYSQLTGPCDKLKKAQKTTMHAYKATGICK